MPSAPQAVDVAPAEAAALAADVQHLDPLAPPGDEPGGSAALAEIAAAVTVPTPVVHALHRYRATETRTGIVLVRGLEVGELPDTPGTTEPAPLEPAARVARLTLLSIASLLGEPFTFADLYGGRLVQHVVPVRGRETAQTSEGSDSLLDWHVEDAHTDLRCDYFGLFCLRGDPAAATRLAPARTAAEVLPGEVVEVLRQPRFVIAPDAAHTTGGEMVPSPVLTGPEADPELAFDAIYQRPADPRDRAAADALRALGEAFEKTAVGVVLEPGELVLVDNRRVAHARTAFQPRFDGRDRWLLRAMVCACGRAHRRRHGARAL